VCLCSKQNPKKYIDDYEKNAQEIKRKEREELNRMIKEQNEKQADLREIEKKTKGK